MGHSSSTSRAPAGVVPHLRPDKLEVEVASPSCKRVSSKSAGSTASTTPPFRRVVCVNNAPVPQGRLRHQRACSAGSCASPTPPFRSVELRNQRNVAQKPWGGLPSCDPAPLTTSFRGLWVSGNAGTGQWWNVRRGGDPKKTDRATQRGGDPKTVQRKEELSKQLGCEGEEGTREPWRRGATDFLQVVAATACATVTSSKPTPLGMECLWSASETGLLGPTSLYALRTQCYGLVEHLVDHASCTQSPCSTQTPLASSEVEGRWQWPSLVALFAAALPVALRTVC